MDTKYLRVFRGCHGVIVIRELRRGPRLNGYLRMYACLLAAQRGRESQCIAEASRRAAKFAVAQCLITVYSRFFASACGAVVASIWDDRKHPMAQVAFGTKPLVAGEAFDQHLRPDLGYDFLCTDRNVTIAHIGRTSMLPAAHNDIITALNQLTAQLQAAKLSRQCRGRGRPSLLNIRRTYIRTETYLEPGMVSALDQLAANIEQRSGRRTHRGDIVRLAIAEYIQRHLSGAEI